jgi:hypothetical protein
MTTGQEEAEQRVRTYLERHQKIYGDRVRTVAVVVGPNGENYVLNRTDMELLFFGQKSSKVVRRKVKKR